MLTNDVRAAFLDYFASEGHTVVPSSPLVPRNDPTLLFTNSGMVQFKNVFTGQEKRAYVRASSAQKCVRAGGKHNDLENVGYTARHHTFFEMLGNFSFGDYFKERAISLAWNFLTRDLKLPKDKLLVTVYADDDEAAKLWRKIADLPEQKIIRIASADNFWAMGDTGPCGPSSEIFYDHGDKIAGGPPGSKDAEGDRFVEIWNLVFMQYEQLAKDNRVALPHPSIDTGMGLERITAVLQGKHDNYDTDILRALIVASAEASHVAADGKQAVSHRVIADHLRASAFLIADGVLPSKEGRGYVLRRIMRRAMRHAHLLGTKEPLMWRLVPVLVRQMGAAYPELGRAEALITETLKLEEAGFRETLARGLELLEEATGEFGKKPGAGLLTSDAGTLSGSVAFVLYDTHGFPLDLTQDILRSHRMKVDVDGFNQEMEWAKKRSRASWVGSGEAATDQLWLELRDKLGATEFFGYDTHDAEGSVVAIVQDGKSVDEAKAGAEAAVLVSQTPFYAESGGQMGDTGTLVAAKSQFQVTDTQKRAGELFVHIGKVTRGALKRGDIVTLKVDEARRNNLRANHSVTHLLHQALRRRLGEHVTQKGSLVAPDRLRFDFANPRALTAEDVAAVEHQVNARIRQNAEVATRLMTPERAVEQGALALFGEKYGDEVRVVSMGHDAEEVAGAGHKHFSVELCGGTHVRRTGDIGFFKIASESAVASGVRRIEALTGAAAENFVAQEQELLRQATNVLKTGPGELPARLQALLDERKRLERELSDARRASALGQGSAAGEGGAPAKQATKDVGGIKFAARALDNVPGKELKALADDLKRELGSGVVALVAREEGKASIVVAVTADLAGRIDAVELVKLGAAALGGKGGGGRPDMAQAGGPDPSQAEAALAAVEQALAKKAQVAA